ncbi:hypothetical protein BaRGS_00016955 [Batillaria attramentaria]|uniref:Uncharacterized protein n=1 Tax=Batillaria attramentaria TaxID=370345 RepID=A0ABD0KXM8_9CAEN
MSSLCTAPIRHTFPVSSAHLQLCSIVPSSLFRVKGGPVSGAFSGWQDNNYPVLQCTWPLGDERDLIAIALSEDNSEENIVSLDIQKQECTTLANIKAEIYCVIDDTTVSVYAKVQSLLKGETRWYDCKRVYFDEGPYVKHLIFNVTNVGRNKGTDYNARDDVCLAVPVIVILFLTTFAVGAIVSFVVKWSYDLKCKSRRNRQNRHQPGSTPILQTVHDTSLPRRVTDNARLPYAVTADSDCASAKTKAPLAPHEDDSSDGSDDEMWTPVQARRVLNPSGSVLPPDLEGVHDDTAAALLSTNEVLGRRGKSEG